MRQWGGTLAWNAELPLPLPLQFDETPSGCRLGFVRINDGAVQLVPPPHTAHHPILAMSAGAQHLLQCTDVCHCPTIRCCRV